MPNTPLNPDLKGYNFIDYRDPIWGDSYNWDFVRTYDQITHLAIHHTVTSHDATPDYIANLHKKRGWGGIGYHLLISYDGTVWYVGDILTGRANIKGNNQRIIGISLIGDFTKELPSAHQILATHRLCKYFMFNFPPLIHITGWDALIGHRDAYEILKWTNSGTTCPSPAWRDPGDSLRNRIIQANYRGYPGWEDARGIEPPKPPEKPPEPPKPPKPPEVITDPSQRIDVGAPWGEVELRKVREILQDQEEALQQCAEDSQVAVEMVMQAHDILFGKGWWWIKYWKLKDLFREVK